VVVVLAIGSGKTIIMMVGAAVANVRITILIVLFIAL